MNFTAVRNPRTLHARTHARARSHTHTHTHTQPITHAWWWKRRRYFFPEFVSFVNLLSKQKNEKKIVSNNAGESYLVANKCNIKDSNVLRRRLSSPCNLTKPFSGHNSFCSKIKCNIALFTPYLLTSILSSKNKYALRLSKYDQF